MNQQEIFDKVVHHLHKQGKPALLFTNSAEGHCAYRGDDGSTCAVGCLIADEFYEPIFEGGGAGRADIQRAVEASLGRQLTYLDMKLLGALQSAHDLHLRHGWASFCRSLNGIIFNLGLTWPEDVPRV